MKENIEIYVVQSKNGIIFTATSEYEKAKEVKDLFENLCSNNVVLSHWINGECTFTE